MGGGGRGYCKSDGGAYCSTFSGLKFMVWFKTFG